MRNIACTALLLLVLGTVGAQVSFNGILISKYDSLPMAFANIKLTEADKYTATNEKGEFAFSIPGRLELLHLEISSIGCHTTIAHKPKYGAAEKIYVDQTPVAAKEVEVRGYTAKSIVKKAVEQIPQNYPDTSYIDYSFYREYQKVNGRFKNLIEAQSAIAFNLSKENGKLVSKEAFITSALRRSNFKYDITDFSGDGYMELLHQNPVFYLMDGSLNPKAFDDYVFSFDTLMLPDAYVIDYVCRDYTSDKHGVENYTFLDFAGESREYGKLTIDRETFAVISIERTAVRNKRYNYPKNNNFLLPSRAYTGEFIAGYLLAEYYPLNGKWYPKRLLHTYTNEYFRTETYAKEYTTTSVFEWYSGSVKRSIPKEMLDRFYFTPGLYSSTYVYDRSKWEKELPDFYFYKKENVLKDLERKMPLEQQFTEEGKIGRKN